MYYIEEKIFKDIPKDFPLFYIQHIIGIYAALEKVFS
jgi:hypothetical protein